MFQGLRFRNGALEMQLPKQKRWRPQVMAGYSGLADTYISKNLDKEEVASAVMEYLAHYAVKINGRIQARKK